MGSNVSMPEEGFLRKVFIFFETIKFSHSVFALPFALVAMLVAANGVPGLWTLFWIVIACVFARTAAMCFNRLVDREFDARNPRTEGRALVTGELSTQFAINAFLGTSIGFIFSAAMLNRTCFLLAVPTLAILCGYSLTKRFTNLSHYFLGIALGLAPIGAWIAVREDIRLTPLLLSLGVLLWVAGFDILYSCQDHDVDSTSEELHSVPKKHGIAVAMEIAKRTHAAAVIAFLLFWMWAWPLGLPSLLAIGGIAVLLKHQHDLVRPDDLSRIDAAFFTTNGIISLGFFFVVLLDVTVL